MTRTGRRVGGGVLARRRDAGGVGNGVGRPVSVQARIDYAAVVSSLAVLSALPAPLYS